MATNALQKEDVYEVIYGNTTIRFRLNFTNRSTLAIHVYPDTSVVIDAPANSTLEKIKNKVLKRAKWIRKQQCLFERFPPALPARKYISGESFRYLGRQYVLKVERGLVNKVTLERGILRVMVVFVSQQRVKELVDDWYRARAHIIFNKRLDICKSFTTKAKIKYDRKLYLRSMKTRWGTCSKDLKITLNPELVAMPTACIDYVIIHELCHLKEHNHSPAFFRLLSFILPDWKKTKELLDTTSEKRIV